MKKFVFAVTLLALFTMVSMLVSQEEKGAMMGQAGPSQEVQGFYSMVGSWDVAYEMQMDPSAPAQQLKGTSTIKKILDGYALQENFESDMGGMTFKGMGIYGYNQTTKKYTSAWVDNMTGNLETSEGEMIDGNLVISGESEMGGMKFFTKGTMFNMAENSFEMKMEVSQDKGETWMQTMHFVYTRKK